MKKVAKKGLFRTGLILGLIAALAACSSPSAEQPKNGQGSTEQPAGEAASGEPNGGIAVYGYHDDVMTFWDPSDSYSNEIVAMNNMYETLLRYNPKDQSFDKVLAEEYKVTDDGLTWTFDLRDNVKFHTGAPMTAESVKKSIERTITRGKGAAFIWDALDTINVVDEDTVEFKLKYAAPLDTIVSSGYAAFIFDVDALEKNGEEWINQGHDVGTGPYTVQKWSKGSDLILTYFPDYWQGWKANQFQKVVFKTIPEANTRQQMLEAGDMDFTDQMPIEMVQAMRDKPGIAVTETDSFQQLVMQLNTAKAPFDNPKVRQALAYAIPYDQIVNDILSGTGSQSHGSIPNGLWGHDASLKQYSYDLDKAKALLQEAGVFGGKLTLTYVSGDEFERRIAELLKVELAKLGFDLEVKGMLWEAQWDMAKAQDPTKRQDILLMYWWADYADPYSFLKNLYASEDEIVFNLAYYKNPEYDELVEVAKQVSGVDRQKAIDLYKQAQEILIEDVPGISLYDVKYVRVLRDNFKGYVDNPAYPSVVFFYDTHRE
ncbi:ABC transporter substrate-binding protein [Brevibacillus humidisoli]|uniref:ABC transporter substrate-binding protein n=1 Tax=Brevibacillus humidisoli TaxID=2895522 RepID=UPI001E2A8B0A|nr:ABC transporter substrate-binding protein [Brevibacillus humidisoli]UFJ40769.1 ABC transporter substrate-binding protein [Brevibacillus humidisoli]